MRKLLLLTISSFLTLVGQTQSIEGVYVGLELNGLRIDSAGQVYFYGVDSFPKQRQFHEVKIIIKSNSITVDKSPVYFDSSGKFYSASDGGFITYQGSLVKAADIYFAKTQMIKYDYMGFSFFDPPKIANDIDTSITNNQLPALKKRSEKELLEMFDQIKERDLFIYFPKGTLKQDYIIRPDKKGIWLNNIFFQRHIITLKHSP